MHSVKINGIELNTDYIISKVDYPSHSKKNNYKDRAGSSPAFFNKNNESKPVSITFVKKEQCMDYLTLQLEIEKFIDTILDTDSPTWVEVDGRYMLAILEKADTEMYKGEVTAIFNNLPGKWYSEEKTATLGQELILEGIEDSDMCEITYMPLATVSSVSLNDDFIRVNNTLENKDVTINLYYKTVKQLGKHVEIDLSSDFFKLDLGSNNIDKSNISDGIVKYREVLAT